MIGTPTPATRAVPTRDASAFSIGALWLVAMRVLGIFGRHLSLRSRSARTAPPRHTSTSATALRAVACWALAFLTLAGAPAPEPIEDSLVYDAFMIGAPLDSSEVAQLRPILEEHERRDPARAARDAVAVQRALAGIRSLPNSLASAVLREHAWREALGGLSSQDPTVRAEVEVVMRSPDLVAADAHGVVTRSSVAAAFAADNAVLKLAGLPPYDGAQVADYATALRGRWSAMPAAERDALLHAADRWAALRRMLADGTMRAAVRRAALAHVHAQDDAPAVARAEEIVGLRMARLQAQMQGPAGIMIPGADFLAAVQANR